MSAAEIHPTAIVADSAVIGAGTVVGPYCVIGDNVTIGADCHLQNHVTVSGTTVIGERNKFFSYGSIGQQTQDLKYAGEPTHLEIGNDNSFREFVTIHRGTAQGGVTRIGNKGNFLAYAHVAHDCTVGDSVIFSNNTTLAGHVTVEDFVIVGGLSGMHQFCRIGKHSIIGGCTKIVQDVPPFMIADGNPAEMRGINKIGLERRGMAKENVRELREAYRAVYRANLNAAQAVEKIRATLQPFPEIEYLAAFIESSERGIVR